MTIESSVIFPAPLHERSRVAILAPASAVKRECVDGAARFLESEGFVPQVMSSAIAKPYGSYSAPLDVRREDMLTALTDTQTDAILCARGGYGAVHLLPDLTPELIRNNPKWLIGFSDITALHAAWLRAGVVSLHAPMAKHLCEQPADDPATRALFRILRGEKRVRYTVDAHPYNICGQARGTLVGGNMAVMAGLAGTPFDIPSLALSRPVILFVEDISEAIYAVERMLCRMSLAGVLDSIKGLIIGQFTEYRPDRNFNSVEDMTSALLGRLGISGIPVAYGFPVGHTSRNMSLAEGAAVELEVTPSGATLVMQP